MLSWSSTDHHLAVDLRGIVDPDVDTGIPAGRALIHLARQVVTATPHRAAFDDVAAEIGLDAAVAAAAVAANFQIMNRVVDAVGLPIGRRRREEAKPIIDALGLDRFPHAQH